MQIQAGELGSAIFLFPNSFGYGVLANIGSGAGSGAGSGKVPGQVPGRFRGRFREGSRAGSGKVPGQFFERRVPGSGNRGFREGSGSVLVFEGI